MEKRVRWYRVMLLKSYFDNGYSLTSPLKWGIGIYGASTLNPDTLGYFVLYLFLCVFFGWLYIKFGFFEAMNEVANRHNLFMKEVRNSKLLKGRVLKKNKLD